MDTYPPDFMHRLAKIEGQVRGVTKMVKDGRYCVDILIQVSAVRSALDQLGVQLLIKHVETCVLQQEQIGEPCTEFSSEERADEIRKALTGFLK